MTKKLLDFLDTITPSIFGWDYFVDFEKAKQNIQEFELELNLLNSLLYKDNFDYAFIKLVNKYPEVRKVLPLLLAIRSQKLKNTPILVKSIIPTAKRHYELFYGEYKGRFASDLLTFLYDSDLKQLFFEVKNLIDYALGVEVGMDSACRKNRTGSLMEKIVGETLSEFVTKHPNLELHSEMTSSKIKEVYGVVLKLHSDKFTNDRRFDFVIYNNNNDTITIIETNYYSVQGSKLNSIAREYDNLETMLKQQGVGFVWVTDGIGWLKMHKALEKTILNNKYVLNLQMLTDEILTDILI